MGIFKSFQDYDKISYWSFDSNIFLARTYVLNMGIKDSDCKEEEFLKEKNLKGKFEQKFDILEPTKH